MEERLREIRPRAPRAELKGRILNAARGELAAREGVWERAWASRLFWALAAAALLIGLLLSRPLDVPARSGAIVAKPSPEADALAETLAAMVGDGEAMERKFAAQLTGPLSVPSSDGTRELMEEIQWRLARDS